MTDKFNLLTDVQLDSISSGKLWNFHGGVHPQENKQQSNQEPISDAGIPATLVIPVEHKGQLPQLLVKIGDMVLKGQALTKVYGTLVVQHASSSGVVIAIEKRCDLHPSGLNVLAVVIQTDGLDRAIEYVKPQDYHTLEPAILVEKIQQSGIVGLGGAGFPSHLKLIQRKNTKLLLINGAECEPYITADDRLMQEQAFEILEGIGVLDYILQPALTVIAIEDNKKDAIASLQEALSNSPIKDKIRLRIIPTIYPSGSEKQLIEIITGHQTPFGKHPGELGIVMQNVGTVFAIKQAIIDAKPLTSRIVTLTGDSLKQRGNVSVRIGTPVQYLLDRYWVDSMSVHQLIIGGPMMGFTIENTAVPVTKTCNCILAPTVQEMPASPPEMPCIRCSECAEACPVNLLPQQLLWYSKSQDHDKLDDYNLSACIECGACAFVCPSHIPLVEYYRIAKAEIRTANDEAQKAEVARIRHEKREVRLDQAKLDRQAKHKVAAEKRKAQLKDKNGGEDLIAAALARAKAKKTAEAQSQPLNESSGAKIENKNSAVAAAIARAKAKKAAKAEQTDNNGDDKNNLASIDPKKIVVAVAIARAKAKKVAKAQQLDNTEQNSEMTNGNNDNEPVLVDPKKVAVAAAIARAKAKKIAKAQQSNEISNDQKNNNANETVPVDPKKAAVAAAIKRAKTKKAEKVVKIENIEQSTSEETEPDNSKVIAERKKRKEQARLRKQEKEQVLSTSKQLADVEKPNLVEKSNNTELSATDIKKAKIAAVVARAKAKKVNAAKESANEVEEKEQQ
jgi:electron transport complex protein RnfC